MKKALVVWGGWDGHEPRQIGRRFAGLLEQEQFDVTLSDTLEAFLTMDLTTLDLIVPVWTMGTITPEQCRAVVEAVGIHGVGLAGNHGGMCDAFRQDTQWQFMTGGQWVAHPGNDGVGYRVHVRPSSSPITEGIGDFDVVSEQYYMHVDPANCVLATTRFPTVEDFHSSNGVVDMPVVWTRRWGRGRVFYSSLGHHNDVFDIPEALELQRRGMLWAAAGAEKGERE
jgi:type 1 glutamine amidotransferase